MAGGGGMAWDLGQSNHLNTGSAAIVGAIVGLFGACLRVWCSRVSTFKMFSRVLSWSVLRVSILQHPTGYWRQLGSIVC